MTFFIFLLNYVRVHLGEWKRLMDGYTAVARQVAFYEYNKTLVSKTSSEAQKTINHNKDKIADLKKRLNALENNEI